MLVANEVRCQGENVHCSSQHRQSALLRSIEMAQAAGANQVFREPSGSDIGLCLLGWKTGRSMKTDSAQLCSTWFL